MDMTMAASQAREARVAVAITTNLSPSRSTDGATLIPSWFTLITTKAIGAPVQNHPYPSPSPSLSLSHMARVEREVVVMETTVASPAREAREAMSQCHSPRDRHLSRSLYMDATLRPSLRDITMNLVASPAREAVVVMDTTVAREAREAMVVVMDTTVAREAREATMSQLRQSLSHIIP